jgi:AcrR family transcriptional regulator
MVTRTTRGPRSDATRNQRLVLDAALAVVAEHGVEASMDEIATRAGVGVGTVYRHFPGKDALIEELVRLAVTDLVAAGEKALLRTDGRGLEIFLRAVGQSFAGHRRYASLLLGETDTDCASTVRRQIAALFEAARQADTIGPDVRLGDVMVLIWGMRGVVEVTGTIAPDAWKRYLDIHLIGLQQPGRISAVRAITQAQLASTASRAPR